MIPFSGKLLCFWIVSDRWLRRVEVFYFFFKILKATKQLTLEQELLKEELSLLSHLTPLNIHDTDLHSRLNVNLIFFESYSTIWNYDSPLKHCGKMQNHKILSIIKRDSRLNLKYLSMFVEIKEAKRLYLMLKRLQMAY